jgi:hypothetical protein
LEVKFLNAARQGCVSREGREEIEGRQYFPFADFAFFARNHLCSFIANRASPL